MPILAVAVYVLKLQRPCELCNVTVLYWTIWRARVWIKKSFGRITMMVDKIRRSIASKDLPSKRSSCDYGAVKNQWEGFPNDQYDVWNVIVSSASQLLVRCRRINHFIRAKKFTRWVIRLPHKRTNWVFDKFIGRLYGFSYRLPMRIQISQNKISIRLVLPVSYQRWSGFEQKPPRVRLLHRGIWVIAKMKLSYRSSISRWYAKFYHYHWFLDQIVHNPRLSLQINIVLLHKSNTRADLLLHDNECACGETWSSC